MAWGRHVTGQYPDDLTTWDKFKSVAVIPGRSSKANGDTRLDDELWAVVDRGDLGVFIEQFQAFDWGDDPDYCWFVDSGLVGYSEGGGGLTNTTDDVPDVTTGEYPTLQELTGGEIPSAPEIPSGSAGAIAVSNATELQNISGSNKYYLTTNIDLNDVSWTPIVSFEGVLDGNDFTISNLDIDVSANEQGLFGNLKTNAEIKNLNFTGCSVSGGTGDSIGILAGNTNYRQDDILLKNITITDCVVSGDVHVGALIGHMEQVDTSYVYDCHVINCTVGTNTDGANHGMLIGTFGARSLNSEDNSYIIDCSAQGGSLTVGKSAATQGGLIGSVQAFVNYTTDSRPDAENYQAGGLYDCYSTAAVNYTYTDTGTSSSIGGLVGFISGFDMISCYATGDITVTKNNAGAVGGLAGYVSFFCTVTDCYATGDITLSSSTIVGFSRIGGLIGFYKAQLSDITRCYATGNITISGDDIEFYGIGGLIGYTDLEWAHFDPGDATIQRCWAEGDITIEDATGHGGVTYVGGGGGFFGIILGSDDVQPIELNILNCYSGGSITSTDDATDISTGGFIGTHYSAVDPSVADIVLTNGYVAQTDTAAGSELTGQLPSNANGFIGDDIIPPNSVTETAIYWDLDTSGTLTDLYAVGQTTDWLQTKSNYEDAGWDFDTVWVLEETVTPGEPGDSEPNTWEGMDHAIGIDVCVYADGRPIGVFNVDANGVLDLGASYDVVIAGINYYSIYETLPLTTYTNFGMKTQLYDMELDFHETMGCNHGVSLTNTSAIQFSDDNFATAIDPYTGWKYVTFPRGITREPIIYLWEWQPIPMTIRGLYPRANIYKD